MRGEKNKTPRNRWAGFLWLYRTHQLDSAHRLMKALEFHSWVSVWILNLVWFRKCFSPNEQTQNQSCWHLPLLQQQLWVIFICQDENQIYPLQYPPEILPLNIRRALTIVSIVLGPGFKNDTSFSFQIQMQTADKTSYRKTKMPRTNKSTIRRLNPKPEMVNVMTMTFTTR